MTPASADLKETARLRTLLEKYEELVALRLAPPGRTLERRDAMRRIAARFPGALREWDQQPLGELERRRDVLRAALADAAAPLPAADWMRYGLDLHEHLREILHLRRFLLAQQAADAALLSEACAAWYRQHGEPVQAGSFAPARLRAIASPAGGRLTALAFAEVAVRHGVTVVDIKRALYAPPPDAATEKEPPPGSCAPGGGRQT